MKNMFDKAKHSNFYSFKGGARISDFPVKNLIITGEYTRTNPLAFKHIISTTTYESNKFNLGNYLHDNSDELYISLIYKPVRGLQVTTSYTHSRKGPDYTSINTPRLGLPFMETVDWEKTEIAGGVQYEIINDGYLYLSGGISDIRDKTGTYTPSFLIGKQTFIKAGMNWGF